MKISALETIKRFVKMMIIFIGAAGLMIRVGRCENDLYENEKLCCSHPQ